MVDFLTTFFVGFWHCDPVHYPVVALGCAAVFKLAYALLGVNR